jgi:hypothetical protein
MGPYADIIGNYYDILGQGPNPGMGPRIGPFGLAFGATDAQGNPIPDPQQAERMIIRTPTGPSPLPHGHHWRRGPYGFGWGWPYDAPVGVPGDPTAALIAAKHSLLARDRGLGVARRELLPFDRTCIGPCETVTLQVSPTVLFKPDRLVIGRGVMFDVVVLAFNVGKWQLFAASGGAFPGDAFGADAEDTNFVADTCQPGVQISLTVQNTSNNKIDFTAGLWGKVIEPGA